MVKMNRLFYINKKKREKERNVTFCNFDRLLDLLGHSKKTLPALKKNDASTIEKLFLQALQKNTEKLKKGKVCTHTHAYTQRERVRERERER